MSIAMDWQKQAKYHDHAVCSMPLWSMAAKRRQADMLSQHTHVVTIEDHLQDGGFGSWMLEANFMTEKQEVSKQTRIKNIALTPEVCGTVGSQLMLNKLGGLSDY